MSKFATPASLSILLAALLCAAGTWLYASRVLIPHQIAYGAEHGQPLGNPSDLYPRWVGARELLLHGRDPYTPEVTREIQVGFYGRPLEPDQPGQTHNYQQGFYYPVYVAFGLAPTLRLPFERVQKGFFRLLVALTVISVPLWLRLLRWPAPLWTQLAIVIFTLGSLPVMQGLKLQQITLFVIPLIAAALVLLALDRQFAAGILLAMATIKPQLVWLVLVWLVLWTIGDWRKRSRWAASFLLFLFILCAASELYLPHWIWRFWQAIREYHSYTGEKSAMEMLIGPVSHVLELASLVVVIAAAWRDRRAPADSSEFAFMACLVLAISVLVVPSYGPYNQALLVPALLFMLKEVRSIWATGSVSRILSTITIILIGWPWIAAIALSFLSFILPGQTVQDRWPLPFWTSLYIPMAVAAGMLVYSVQRTFTPSRYPSPS
jgi:hypothetical protein